MSRKRILSGIALAVVLAACGTSGGDPLGPGTGPSFDGGPVTGGNKTDSTSTSTSTDSTTIESAGPIAGGN